MYYLICIMLMATLNLCAMNGSTGRDYSLIINSAMEETLDRAWESQREEWLLDEQKNLSGLTPAEIQGTEELAIIFFKGELRTHLHGILKYLRTR